MASSRTTFLYILSAMFLNEMLLTYSHFVVLSLNIVNIDVKLFSPRFFVDKSRGGGEAQL